MTVDVLLSQSIWIKDQPAQPDQHVAFRASFTLEATSEVDLRSLGSGWYEVFLDGRFLLEGPLRYPHAHPEYDRVRVRLEAGPHVLAVHAHHLGIDTRLQATLPPFLCFLLLDEHGDRIALEWTARPLAGHRDTGRRINGQLPWVEWVDTREEPADWQRPDYVATGWGAVEQVPAPIGKPHAPTISPVMSAGIEGHLLATGLVADTFGYETDDPAARFFLRDLHCEDLPADGIWRRYDLGRVRLARPDFIIDAPAGTVIEFAYCEALHHGRVHPWIPLSLGASCNLDHFVARGGPQAFRPLHSKGGRFVELHVTQADPDEIRIMRERFIERAYYPPTMASLETGDPLLDRIWTTGIETFRACSEDALVDTPTRERGQWTGDLVGVGLELAAVGYPDLRLIRRGLRQAAECALPDGKIASLSPGQICCYTSYAVQWVTACVRYWELSGEREILTDCYAYAENNMESFERHLGPLGIDRASGVAFIDWGFQSNQGPADVAFNLHYLEALRAMTRWCGELGQRQREAHYQRLAEQVGGLIADWMAEQQATDEMERPDFHLNVLALRLGLVPPHQVATQIARIKQHLLVCFPNNPHAVRNDEPALASTQLITPYFAHYALAVLIEQGQMDFVLDQYRTCWGWALRGGRTTWVEVFDTRWSHCHQWSGCPTWQLTRYVLGLHPRFDRGPWHFDFNFAPGPLKQAQGRIPVAGTDAWIEVAWTRCADAYSMQIESPEPLQLIMITQTCQGLSITISLINANTGEPWLAVTH